MKKNVLARILPLFALSLFVLVAGRAVVAADQPWTGKISDSMCGASHKSAMEHGGKKMSDADCVKACVDKGAKYVLVSGGKKYAFENQDFAGLAEHAGHTVKVTDEKSGDTIRVTSIEMSGK
jgi:hypothetical protein